MPIKAHAHDLMTILTSGIFTAGPEDIWAQAQREGWSADAPEAYCQRCGVSAGPGSVTAAGCSFCRETPVAWDRIVRLSTYREPLRQWLTAMKFQRQWSWCDLLGRELADRLDAVPVHGSPLFPQQSPQNHTNAGPTVVCPVPMHWLRRWRRGYNQAQLLAMALARRRGWACTEILRRVRHNAPQTSVPPSQRISNIRGSFAARRIDLAGWDVWLVDDIKTTGATLTACAVFALRLGAKRERGRRRRCRPS